MSADLTFDDITWSLTLDRVLKNNATGLITEIKYTLSGIYGDYLSKVANNYATLPPSDPNAAGFIAASDLTAENVISWVDSTITECPVFDLEAARVSEVLPYLDADDPKQPKNQDLSGFRFSSYKEQLQQTILAAITVQIAEAESNAAVVEHSFE
jgi:hypothetical protein